MKIRKIEFINNKILGNLNLDFTDEDSKVANTSRYNFVELYRENGRIFLKLNLQVRFN